MHQIADYQQRISSVLRYYRKAKSIYDVHSPFLYELLEAVMRDNRSFFTFEQAEGLRAYWLRQKAPIYLSDVGAPSKVFNQSERTAGQIVRASAISPRVGRWLFRLALHLRPQYLLELGTNVGLSSIYLHGADRRAALHTIEGATEIAKMAQHSFQAVKATEQLQLHLGTFDQQIPPVLESLPRLDFLFMDGDHRKSATLRHVRTCLPKLHHDSVVVIGDIHWSPDMEAAWEQLKQLPEVTLSVDLYEIGLLFFRSELKIVQHWTIIPTPWKPWRALML